MPLCGSGNTLGQWFRVQVLEEGGCRPWNRTRHPRTITEICARGALFEVIRKVACAQASNMRMVLRISLSDRSQYHSHVADLRTRNFANDFK
jgi:hypothetical protein